MKRFCLLPALLFLLALPVRAAAPERINAATETLGEGVEYSREQWRFDDGAAREVRCITVDMARCTLLLATPGDEADNDGGGGQGAALADMANAAIQNGKRVLGGVNGDFYKTSADGGAEYAPYAALGVLVKDGVLLSDGQRAEGAMYFGVTREGDAVMGSAQPDGDWDSVKSGLLTAVGGELWLVHQGESNLASLRWRTDSPILSARYGSAGAVYDENGGMYDFPGAFSSYPRTAVGILSDGRVLLLCAGEGGVSPGLTVPHLTELLLEKGCTEAMNLDGGPSTQLLIPEDGRFAPGSLHGVSRRIGVGLLAATGRGEDALGDMSAATDAPSRSPLWLIIPALLLLAAGAWALWRRQHRRRGKHAA